MDEIVKLKGTGDGVKIYLSSQAQFHDIIKSLHSKLAEYRRFFGDGKCNIYFVGRELDEPDKIRLESISRTMLPEASVHYGEKRIFKLPKKNSEITSEPKPYVPTMAEVVANNFKANRARFFEGVVKSGKKVESDSHMVLVGDVMEDAEVTAAGNIVIFGRLMGKASAGTGGSTDAYIIALDFCPQSISIAGLTYYVPEHETIGAKKAKLINNEISVEEFLLNI